MKLSIITINFNNAEGLRKTLASVAAQTYRNIEHIIVDGGSTDQSVDIIRDYYHRFEIGDLKLENVIWTSEPDTGIYNAINKGIRKATGDYVWILNSGDCVAALDVVERMISILNSLNANSLNITENVPILIGNIVRLHDNKKGYAPLPVKQMKDENPRPIDVSMLTFYGGTVPQDAAFVRRDLFEKYGYFDESLKICADWKLYLNMIALGDIRPMHVNIDVVLFDMTGISNANNELRLAERREYLEQILPSSVLRDYDTFSFPISQYQRLKKYHLWRVVWFFERVLFKLEKWKILK